MNIYFTVEPCKRLKNLFSNLSSYYIIDVDSILEGTGLDINKKAHQFLINNELERLLISGCKSKRYIGIIYINSKMTFDTISSVKESVFNAEGSLVEGAVGLDDCDVQKLSDYYVMFDEVIFFPTVNKAKIIKCVPQNVIKFIK